MDSRAGAEERPRRRSAWLLAVATGAALMLVVGLWWTRRPATCATGVCAPIDSIQGSSTLSPDRSGQEALFGAQDAASVVGAFNARDPDVVRSVLSQTLQANADAIAAQAVPPGSVLSIDAGAATQLSPQLVRVPATLSGPEPTTFVMVLERQAGRWVVVGTSAPGEAVAP